MKQRLVLGGLALAAIGLLSSFALLRNTTNESSWKELKAVEELSHQFNEDRGAVRIVLLLSPT